jgi:hypothetical protein
MWSKNGTEVDISDVPEPSRFRESSMLDSLVSRESCALLLGDCPLGA